MRVVAYNNLSKSEKINFYTFLKSTQQESKPASINMWHDNWIDNNNTLPFLLEKTDRFDTINGMYYILFNNATVVGCSGVYVSDFSNNIALAGVRTWVTKNYRHNSIVREYLLPVQKSWCHEKNIKIIALSFNEYNKNLIQVFKQRRLGESKERLTNREPHHLFYNNLNEISFPLNIQFTKQWLIYERLDLDFTFDWSTIAYT